MLKINRILAANYFSFVLTCIKILGDFNSRHVEVENGLHTLWKGHSKYAQIYPIHNDSRYFLFKSFEVEKGEENYGVVRPIM
jgi:hypothetical protein